MAENSTAPPPNVDFLNMDLLNVDPFSSKGDLSFDRKLSMIFSCLTPEMKAAIEQDRLNREREDEAITKLALRAGVDYDVLRDLRAAFMSCDDGQRTHGVSEDVFLASFAPTLCRGLNEEQTHLWYRLRDLDCSGSLQWSEISTYLAGHRRFRPPDDEYFMSAPLDVPLPAKGENRPSHRGPICRVVHAGVLPCLYTAAGDDGLVLCWAEKSLVPAVLVHEKHTPVVDLAMLPLCRLLVLLSDSSMFLYSPVSTAGFSLEHELVRAFACEGVVTRTFVDGRTFYVDVDQFSRRLDSKVVQRGNLVERVTKNMTPATLLDPMREDALTCIDWAASVGEGVLVAGTRMGHIVSIPLLQYTRTRIPIQRLTKAHRGTVTRIRWAPDLGSILSSSVDASVAFVEYDKSVLGMRMQSRHAIFDFLYHPFLHTLLTWERRTLHVWNALTGVLMLSLPRHDSPIASVALNPELMQVYVLLENRRICAWDLLTWKSMGQSSSVAMRSVSGESHCIVWSQADTKIITSTTSLWGWRTRKAQERIDAGVPPSAEVDGHLHPIRVFHEIPRVSHVVAIDAVSVGVWGLRSRRMLAQWRWPDPSNMITASNVAPDGKKMLLGTENGSLGYYNYTCGFCIRQLLHSFGGHHVHGISTTRNLQRNIEVVTAAIGEVAVQWQCDMSRILRNAAVHPTATYNRQRGTALLGVCDLHGDRDAIVASYSDGVCIVLSSSMHILQTIDAHLPAERLFPIVGDVFMGLHPDGTLREYALNPSATDMRMMMAATVAFADGESPTCVDVMAPWVVVGDSGGCVSVFELGNLVDPAWLRVHGVPALFDKSGAGAHVLAAAAQSVTLLASFEAHEGAVTAVKIVGTSVLTSGGDRIMRLWRLEGGRLLYELGSSEELGEVLEPSRLEVDAHAFHRSDVATYGDVRLHGRRSTNAMQFGRHSAHDTNAKSAVVSLKSAPSSPLIHRNDSERRPTVLGDVLHDSHEGHAMFSAEHILRSRRAGSVKDASFRETEPPSSPGTSLTHQASIEWKLDPELDRCSSPPKTGKKSPQDMMAVVARRLRSIAPSVAVKPTLQTRQETEGDSSTSTSKYLRRYHQTISVTRPYSLVKLPPLPPSLVLQWQEKP